MKVEELSKEFETIFTTYNINKHKITLINGKTLTLEVCINCQDKNVDLDLCEKVSREISNKLDEIDFLDTEYNLDVCSFGAEYELELNELKDYLEQYIFVQLKDPKKGIDQVTGYLKEVTDNEIKIDYLEKGRNKQVNVDIENIKLVRLAVKL